MVLFPRAFLLLPLACACAQAQSVTPTLGETIKPAAAPDRNIYSAGETISVTVRLGVPAPRDIRAIAYTTTCGPTIGAMLFQGEAKRGDTSITLTRQTDRLMPDAKCAINQIQIQPPDKQSAQTSVIDPTVINLPNPIRIEITGMPRVSETLEANVTAEANVSERQYMRSRSVGLRSYREGVTSYLDKNANESTALDDLLIQTLTDARSDLLRTRDVFTARYRPDGSHPVFFDDLERR